jgi:hypothetical protein
MNKKIFFAVGLLLMAHAAFPQKSESFIPGMIIWDLVSGLGKFLFLIK